MIRQTNLITPNKSKLFYLVRFRGPPLFSLLLSLYLLPSTLFGFKEMYPDLPPASNSMTLVPTGLEGANLHTRVSSFFQRPFDAEKPPIRISAKYASWVDNLYQLSGQVIITKKFITARSQGAIYLKNMNILKLHIGPEIKEFLPADPPRKKVARLLHLQANVIIWDENKNEFIAESNATLWVYPYGDGGRPESQWTLKITGDRIKSRTDIDEIESRGNAKIEDKSGFGRGEILTYYDKENLVKLEGTDQVVAYAERKELDKKTGKWVERNLQGKVILYDTDDESVFSE